MSLKAMTCAMALRGVTASEKLLLLALANYADEEMSCYPSQRRLAADTCLTPRTIWTLLNGLEKRGMISRKENTRRDGSRSSDSITLHFTGEVTEAISGGAEIISGGVPKSLPGGVEMVSPLTSFEPVIDPVKGTHCPAKPNRVREDWFSKGWDAYPRQGRERSKSRDKTLPIWREAARRAGGGERLVAAVQRYVREDKQHKGECGPPGFHRWLNDGKWEHWLPEARAPSASSGVSADVYALHQSLLNGTA